MGKTSKITKEMEISEVIRKHPETVSVFLSYGLHCIGCPMAAGESSETIEQASDVHRIDLEKFLKEINGKANPVRNKPPQAAVAVPSAGRISNGAK
jgi:hybrid cluster-associated redox disulfide protein